MITRPQAETRASTYIMCNRVVSLLASSHCDLNSKRKQAKTMDIDKLTTRCVETLGAWGPCTHSLVRRIGSRVMEQSGDNRATQFLIQKAAAMLHL